MNDRISGRSIGLALGSGASRGWSHVGIIKALIDEGIEPDVVCGTSVGAMVGAAYVAGNLEKLADWVLGTNRADVLRFFDIKWQMSGFIDVERMDWFVHKYVADEDVMIEDLPKRFLAVCTNLATGEEVWREQGPLAKAVGASMALPGLFPAVRDGDRWLVDGGLVNPVPVSACRALGADIVIGVNLNSDIVGKHLRRDEQPDDEETAEPDSVLDNLKRQAREYSNSLFTRNGDPDEAPGVFQTVTSSINIFQHTITHNRLRDDPADVLLAPKLGDIGLLEFQRAAEAMDEGRDCVTDALPDIRRAISA